MKKLPKISKSLRAKTKGGYSGKFFFKGFARKQYCSRLFYLLGDSCSDGDYIVVLYYRGIETLFFPYGLAVVSFDFDLTEQSFEIVQLQATRQRRSYWASIFGNLIGKATREINPNEALKDVRRWEHQLVQVVEVLARELKHDKIAIQPAESNFWMHDDNKLRFRLRYDVTAKRLGFKIAPFCYSESWVKKLD